jgi:hypothetical protein
MPAGFIHSKKSVLLITFQKYNNTFYRARCLMLQAEVLFSSEE